MNKPIHYLTTEQFNEEIKKDTYTLIDFTAKWCGPCHRISPIYQQFANKYECNNFKFFNALL